MVLLRNFLSPLLIQYKQCLDSIRSRFPPSSSLLSLDVAKDESAEMPPPPAPLDHLQPLLSADDIELDEKALSSIPENNTKTKYRRTSAQCKLTLLASLLGLLVFLGWSYTQEGDSLTPYSHSHSRPPPPAHYAPVEPITSLDRTLKQCPSAHPSPPPLPVPHNPWLPLTSTETSQIQSWLEDTPELGLNLTKASEGRVNDNVVYNIELGVPGKKEVLGYLDRGCMKRVERYARVTVHHGGVAEPHVKDYRVGPLPISSTPSYLPLPLLKQKH
jgi:Copper amine oxidase, N2 domain